MFDRTLAIVYVALCLLFDEIHHILREQVIGFSRIFRVMIGTQLHCDRLRDVSRTSYLMGTRNGQDIYLIYCREKR